MRKIIIAMLVTLVVIGIVIWTFPADLGKRLVASKLGPVDLTDLSGSVWNGHAASVRVFGRDLGALDWQMQPGSLMNGEVTAQFTLNGPNGTASGIMTRGRNNTLDVRNVKATVPAALFEDVIAVRDLHLEGKVDVDLSHARVHGDQLEAADGSATWKDAAVSRAAQARMSDMRATFGTQPDGQIVGDLKDLGGPLQADGLFQIKGKDYSGEARLVPRNADPHVIEALQHIGQPQADGSVILKVSGHMNKVL